MKKQALLLLAATLLSGTCLATPTYYSIIPLAHAASPAACDLPWGGSLASGASVTAYTAQSVQAPSSCATVELTASCSAGILSPANAAYGACTVTEPPLANCTLPWGGTLADGATYANPTYSAPTVNEPGSCASVQLASLLCTNGTLSTPAPSNVCSVVDQHWANVSLLLHLDTSSWTDATGLSSGAAATNVALTPNAKFGAGAAQFVGGTSFIQTGGAASSSFGANNFTVEFWINFDSVAAGQQPLSGYLQANFNWAFYTSAGSLKYYLSSNGVSWDIASGPTVGNITPGQWYHVALVRNGNTITSYLNGTPGGTTTTTASLHSTNDGVLVGGIGSGYAMSGKIDEVRITKNVARYTGAFVPRSSSFLNQ